MSKSEMDFDTDNKVGAMVDDYYQGLADSIKALQNEVDSQFRTVDAKSRLIKYYNKVTNESELNTLANDLVTTNYRAEALVGEDVLLLTKPLFVSKVICDTPLSLTSNSNVLRLITYKNSSRKVATADALFSHPRPRSHYSVGEVIFGFVLPQHCTLSKIKLLDVSDLFVNEELLAKISSQRGEISEQLSILKKYAFEQAHQIDIELSSKLAELGSVKEEIQAVSREKNRLQGSIKTQNETYERITQEIVQSTESLTVIENDKNDNLKSLSKIREQLEQNNKLLSESERNINEANGQLSSLKLNLRQAEADLAKAKADINVTTLDIKGFSTESRQQISRYFWLAAFALTLLAFIFSTTYDNAKTLVELVDKRPSLSVWNILLSRLPLITVTALIVGSCSALLFVLVKNMISVSDDKMNMLKASILAEQITDTVVDETMSEEQVNQLKRDTKIRLVMNIFNKKPKDQESQE